jgi:hypothetical protein
VAGNGRKNADAVLMGALAGGATVQDAARQAGIGERTAYRRLEDAAFRGRIDELRRAMLERAAGALADATTRAVRTLVALLDDESPTARLGAARSILEHANSMRELVSLEERVAALEAATGGGGR